MKKSKLLVLGLIALVLAGGLVLASCRTECGGSCGYVYSGASAVDISCDSCDGTKSGCKC
jgi:hypothetical protein